MKPFIYQQWHAWEGTWDIMLSNEDAKVLRSFSNTDECINWLYLSNSKDAARALNAHINGTKLS